MMDLAMAPGGLAWYDREFGFGFGRGNLQEVLT